MKTTVNLNPVHTEDINNLEGVKIGDFSCSYNHQEGIKPENIDIRVDFSGGVFHTSGTPENIENIINQVKTNFTESVGLINSITPTEE